MSPVVFLQRFNAFSVLLICLCMYVVHGTQPIESSAAIMYFTADAGTDRRVAENVARVERAPMCFRAG